MAQSQSKKLKKPTNISASRRNLCIFRIAVCWFVLSAMLPTSLLAAPATIISKTEQSSSMDVLEVGQKEKVQRALMKAFGVREPSTISPLMGGFSQKLYKLSIKNKDYVLRLSNAIAVNLKREIKCMTIASKIGIAPRVYYANPKDGVLVMEYIENVKLTDQDRSDPAMYIKLAKLLKTLHYSSHFPKYRTIFEHIRGVIKKTGFTPSGLSKIVMNNLEPIEKLFNSDSMMASCHNDLNPNNILFDGHKFWLIDWESASIGDPYFDLATISNFFILHPKLEELYLKTYFNGKPNKRQLAHYTIMKQVSLSYYGIALTSIAKTRNLPPLSESEIQDLPTLQDFYMAQASKENSLDNPENLEKSLIRFGAIMMKESIKNMKSAQFQKQCQNKLVYLPLKCEFC